MAGIHCLQHIESLRPTALADDDSFMEGGIIDSTGTLELIMHLETEYGVTVEDEELVPENLDSINSLCQFITAKRAAMEASTCN